MTPKLKLSENLVQRLQNINEEKLGALYGLMYDGILLVIGLSIEVEGTSFQELQSHFPTEVDFCGIVTFKSSHKEEITSSISDQLKEVLVSDNPLLLNYDQCEKSLQAFFCHNEKLVEACYDILTEADVCQIFAHIRLQTCLPFVCELGSEAIFEAINALQKKVSSGSVAFRISDSNIYLFGDEMEGLSPTVGEFFSGTASDHIEGSPRNLNQSKSPNKHQQSSVDNLRVMRVSLMQKCTRDSQTEGGLKTAPVLQFIKHGDGEDTQRLRLMLPIDGLSMVHLERKASELYNVLVDSLCRSLRLLERSLSRGQLPPTSAPSVLHFRPPAIGHFFTAVYPKGQSDDDLESVRRTFHQQLHLPTNKPLFRPSNAHNFDKKAATSNLLHNVHEGLPPSGVKDGQVGVVQGRYAYHHYMQDGKDDNGWGCAYRSLQTLVSWFQLQGYTNREVPTHTDIQRCLVDLGDKPPSFVGSRQWIGSTEVNYCLDAMLGVTCRIMFVSSGEELTERGSELLMHFTTQGTPIMIGGGVLAHTILGVDFNRETGDIKFLVLDPHYTGEEDLNIIQNKGWVGWKKPSFWDKKSFYNLCMPVRPVCI
ncbi:ufm1-specific protease 2 [Nilaparvata lugens]|uniref:ufm1-specific protease 2 n=1 Tax=Nilaparvata lugens TaxID=108931 RepID=UPI00193EB317|nr:ufm1-specific protease 2 [Nilaparvata lugens]